ncbi:hypothetical protein GGX14DRAFT_392123 [Mycena pura]|uniref:Uncharacterized protein n=1 Tax=Mycena pura TaxID=153505 RepID=A0AAD6YD73_9AGAR|nr:hypothetical protein GGX14DRAFT_392123 [Mycena pura]
MTVESATESTYFAPLVLKPKLVFSATCSAVEIFFQCDYFPGYVSFPDVKVEYLRITKISTALDGLCLRQFAPLAANISYCSLNSDVDPSSVAMLEPLFGWTTMALAEIRFSYTLGKKIRKRYFHVGTLDAVAAALKKCPGGPRISWYLNVEAGSARKERELVKLTALLQAGLPHTHEQGRLYVQNPLLADMPQLNCVEVWIRALIFKRVKPSAITALIRSVYEPAEAGRKWREVAGVRTPTLCRVSIQSNPIQLRPYPLYPSGALEPFRGLPRPIWAIAAPPRASAKRASSLGTRGSFRPCLTLVPRGALMVTLPELPAVALTIFGDRTPCREEIWYEQGKSQLDIQPEYTGVQRAGGKTGIDAEAVFQYREDI